VLVTPSSGEPGSGGNINIRGITSPLSGSDNDPLYVIDGVPFQRNPTMTVRDETQFAAVANPLLSLDPDNIKKKTVLKDASATAIYGSQGANGVILIETKRGERDQPTQVS